MSEITNVYQIIGGNVADVFPRPRVRSIRLESSVEANADIPLPDGLTYDAERHNLIVIYGGSVLSRDGDYVEKNGSAITTLAPMSSGVDLQFIVF